MAERTPGAYFDEQWAQSEDPWDLGGRWYETRKYDITVACLPRPRYHRAFEPGCGPGLLTQRLAVRAARVLAADRHPRAVEVTARRCRATGNVAARVLCPPAEWPAPEDGPFDLVVLSEVLYYLDDDGLAAFVDGCLSRLATGGDLVAVHYRPDVADHARSGDDAHRHLGRAVERAKGRRLLRHVEDEFVLEAFRIGEPPR